MILLSKKNKKEVVINNAELQPTVLYTIKAKKVNLFAIILLFGLFIGVIYYLPQLSEMYQAYKKGETSSVKRPLTTTNDKNEDEGERYNYASNLTISTDDFTISDFSLNNNLLRYTVTNEKSINVDFRFEHYYLEVYGPSNRLITRLKLAEDTFTGNEKKNYSFNISASSISYFLLKEIKEDEYEAITLSKDSNNNATLTCEAEGDRLIYNFTNDELIRIAEVKTVETTDTNYQSELTKYQNQVTTYQNYPGVQNNINVTDTNFVYNIIIDLNTANVNSLDNVKFYAHKTNPKVVNFEMQARGYVCQ